VFYVAGGQKGLMRQYHVLFFGDEGERGWIIESSAIVYAGRAAFDRHCQSLTGRSNVKERKNYVIAANRRRAWEIAVASAEHAWMLSREQRIAEFLPAPPTSCSTALLNRASYPFDDIPCDYLNNSSLTTDISRSSIIDQCTTSSKRLSSSGNEIKVETSCPAKQARTSVSYREQQSSLSPNPERTTVQFTVFCQSRREVLSRNHSDYSKEEIDKLLKEEWCMMESKAQIRIMSSSSDTFDSSQSSSLSSQNEGIYC